MWVCVVIGVVGIGGLVWRSWVMAAGDNGRYIPNNTAVGSNMIALAIAPTVHPIMKQI